MVCLLILTTTSHMTMPDSEGGERLPCVEMLFFKSILSTHLSYSVISEFKREMRGFPGGSVVKKKKSTYQCRGHGFNASSRKISHVAEQLNPRTMTIGPVL